MIISIPQSVISDSLENFLTNDLKMDLMTVGCGSIEFRSKGKPENFDNLIKKKFGKIIFDNILMVREDNNNNENDINSRPTF